MDDGQDERTAGLAARRLAYASVADLLGARSGTALDDVLDPAASRAALPGPDLALARAIATATFRHLGLIRHALAARLAEGLPEGQPKLLALLATGAAQILVLNVQDHAAVDLAVRLAKADSGLRHLSGLVNAVLRRISREKAAILREGEADPLGIETPGWLARRWSAAYGAETARSIAAAHLRGAPLDLSVRGDPAPWAERLGARLLPTGSLRLDESRTPVPLLPGFAEGEWWVQDAAAALPARLLAVRPGERVADLCAAPGGKTAQLAAAGASVLAVDRSEARLRRLRENLARLGLTAEARAADALALPEDERFDAILLDAPCSATGTIRRHPDVAWTKREADLGRLTALQARLLDKAARLLRPGGRLVYCTCSLEPEEGEGQAEAFLARHPDFARRPVDPAEIGGEAALLGPAGDLRTLPCAWLPAEGGRGGLDGFFAVRLGKAA
ncbi:Fmu (Sun) domain protein [Methylobacterium sp. 4-46]|uniref:RsmB/NOP family class I SAM-dependent RNA methyltransferase n=1 Tax=unclassified Methylobacterium TaxID=2615210 RepID=UPI000165C5EE|nr:MULTISPECIES: RsmB/NOP family class I SAM-dependent RNA methyltransferase [Methylobacterium]ACA17375.1 Fmu (Sun) domain protein [Methylobacterium sp. 4-46]WFT83062.1 RsmB/NOP family class I SAM-dependent RNA methyltransferase [Methylobacterium nodulans]